MIDVGCLLLIVLKMLHGWRSGALLTLLSLVGLLISSSAAFILHRPVGRALGGVLSLQPILSYPLGGLTVFLAIFITTALLARRLRRRRRLARAAGTLSRAGQAGGALLGGVHGAIFLLLLAWILLLLRSFVPGAPDIRGSVAGKLATPLASRFVYAVAHGSSDSRTLARTASRIAKNPRAATKDLTQLMQDRRVQALLMDRKFLEGLASGEVRSTEARRTVHSLTTDRAWVGRACRLGLLDGDPASLKPHEVQQQLAARIAPMARAARALSRDPEVRQLLGDPALAKRLEQRNLWELANDPKFNRLLDIISRSFRSAGKSPPKKERDRQHLTPE